jgi:hypothetical protein
MVVHKHEREMVTSRLPACGHEKSRREHSIAMLAGREFGVWNRQDVSDE